MLRLLFRFENRADFTLQNSFETKFSSLLSKRVFRSSKHKSMLYKSQWVRNDVTRWYQFVPKNFLIICFAIFANVIMLWITMLCSRERCHHLCIISKHTFCEGLNIFYFLFSSLHINLAYEQCCLLYARTI